MKTGVIPGIFLMSYLDMKKNQDENHKQELIIIWNIQILFTYHHTKSLSPGDCCNIEQPSETHLKLTSHQNSFFDDIHVNCQIILKICTEHGSTTAMLCAKFQNDWLA